MIRYRLKKLVDTTLVLALLTSLCIFNYATQQGTSVDTQPNNCTPVTETPYAGATYVTSQMVRNCTDSIVPTAIYVVGTGLESLDNISETNDEEQSIQSATTDEYSMTIENDDVSNIEDNKEPVEENVDPEQGADSTSQPVITEIYGVSRQTEEQSATTTTEVLNLHNGRVSGPSGEETYYNLNMGNCVSRMQSLGYDYEYWVRDDGVKMFGPYVMVAADFKTRPLGTVLETSLGTGIVADTGDFVKTNPTQLDIATAW